jgi:hypothetical protein
MRITIFLFFFLGNDALESLSFQKFIVEETGPNR